MSAVLRWEEPPPRQSRGRPVGYGTSRWTPVADELRSRPGEWALIAEGPVDGGGASALATHIRMGQPICWSPAGDFDAESRRGNGTRRVWARYVGGEE